MKEPEGISKLIQHAMLNSPNGREQDLALLEVIRQIQIEAYNEAIDDCVKNITINVDRCAYGHELTEFYKPFSINKQSILKLKK